MPSAHFFARSISWRQKLMGFKLIYILTSGNRHFSHRTNMIKKHCCVHLPILFVNSKMIQWGWSASPPVLVNESKRNIRSHIILGLTLQLDCRTQWAILSNPTRKSAKCWICTSTIVKSQLLLGKQNFSKQHTQSYYHFQKDCGTPSCTEPSTPGAVLNGWGRGEDCASSLASPSQPKQKTTPNSRFLTHLPQNMQQ